MNGRVAHERGRAIRELVAAKRRAFLAMQVGHSIPALTLSETSEGMRIALTTNYLKVGLPSSSFGENELLDVHIGRADGGLLYGYPCDRGSLTPAHLISEDAQC